MLDWIVLDSNELWLNGLFAERAKPVRQIISAEGIEVIHGRDVDNRGGLQFRLTPRVTCWCDCRAAAQSAASVAPQAHEPLHGRAARRLPRQAEGQRDAST